MKKSLILITLMSLLSVNAQVGINIPESGPDNQIKEALDVNGKVRVRQLPDVNNDYKRVIVSKSDGTLGYRYLSSFKNNVILKNYKLGKGFAVGGLLWNSRDIPSRFQDAHKRTQTNSNIYVLYGETHSLGVNNDNWNPPVERRNFSIANSEVINFKLLLNFSIQKNYYRENSNTPDALSTVSVHGDRQVVLIVNLFKGNTLVRRVSKVVNFNGRNEEDFFGDFSESIDFSFSGETGDDYNLAITSTIKAPEDGNFRIDFTNDINGNPIKQYIEIIKG